jgi:hypothetical protein
MKTAALIVLLAIPASLQAQTPDATPVSDQRTIRANVETVMLASLRGDTAVLSGIYAPDYRMGDRSGGTINRFVRIRQVAANTKPQGTAWVPAYVRVMGNVAVAGGRVPNSRDEWLQIWDRQAGEWKLSYEEYARPMKRRRS